MPNNEQNSIGVRIMRSVVTVPLSGSFKEFRNAISSLSGSLLSLKIFISLITFSPEYIMSLRFSFFVETENGIILLSLYIARWITVDWVSFIVNILGLSTCKLVMIRVLQAVK